MPGLTSKTAQPTDHLYALDDFFTRFAPREAHTLLNRMIRAAFAQNKQLDKNDILDFIYLKDELVKLLDAAEKLAADKANIILLKKFFVCKKTGEWKITLNELFYAASYDGFFITPPNDDDIYHTCRGLLKIIEKCAAVYNRDKHTIINYSTSIK